MKVASFAKLKDGTYGLRGQHLKQGEQVQVTTKAGKVSVETVGHVLSGPFDDGNCLAKTMENTTAPTVGIAPCPTCGQARRAPADQGPPRQRQAWGQPVSGLGGARPAAKVDVGANGDGGDDIPI